MPYLRLGRGRVEWHLDGLRFGGGEGSLRLDGGVVEEARDELGM